VAVADLTRSQNQQEPLLKAKAKNIKSKTEIGRKLKFQYN
jgi:hypothetical protein